MISPRIVFSLCFAISLVAAPRLFATEPAAPVDLRQAVPSDAFMAMHFQHDPKRDYERAYMADVWQTIQDEKLPQRILEIITNRANEKDVDAAKAFADEMKAAVAPIDSSRSQTPKNRSSPK